MNKLIIEFIQNMKLNKYTYFLNGFYNSCRCFKILRVHFIKMCKSIAQNVQGNISYTQQIYVLSLTLTISESWLVVKLLMAINHIRIGGFINNLLLSSILF